MHPFILFSRFTRVIDRWTPTAVEGRNSKIVCVVSVSLCVGGSWRSVRISSNPIANINNFFMGYFYDFSARSLSGNTLLLLLLLPLLVWFNKGLQFGYVRTDRHLAPGLSVACSRRRRFGWVVVFIHKTADGLTLRAQDKRGALAISPTIVFSVYY